MKTIAGEWFNKAKCHYEVAVARKGDGHYCLAFVGWNKKLDNKTVFFSAIKTRLFYHGLAPVWNDGFAKDESKFHRKNVCSIHLLIGKIMNAEGDEDGRIQTQDD